MFGKEKIPVIEGQIRELQQHIESLRTRLRGLHRHGTNQIQVYDNFFASVFDPINSETSQRLHQAPLHRWAAWGSPRWLEWIPPLWAVESSDTSISDNTPPNYIRIGDLVEERLGATFKYRIPALAPFIGQNSTIIVRTKGSQHHNEGLALLQSLLIRATLNLPHQVAFLLLDPAGNGAAFPMRRHLTHVHNNSGDVRRDLESVIQGIQRINETYLDASTPSFEMVDPQIRINERYQLVFAADFPNKYDRRAIEAIQSVANTGPRTGTYVFIHHNLDIDMPRDISFDEIKNGVVVDLTQEQSFTPCSLVFRPDTAPEPRDQDYLFEKIRSTKPPERKVDWKAIIPSASEWWKNNTNQLIQTPIGVSGATGTLDIWFGMNDEGLACAHGMLGAMTGAGKSNLYHVLILGLCTRYGPQELRLYLIDGKDGVEFQMYRELPHAEVVSLKSSPQLSRSVLSELVSERERRNAIFSSTGVNDLSSYRALGQPKGNLPRILLLVDEYQELFEGDKDGEASALLLQLAQQGRSAGIHMLLGSQRYGAPGMLNQSAIFGNVHLRLAMQMTTSDVHALSEFGRRGKQLILTCDMPGKIVVNDRSGDDTGNKAGKVAYISSDQRRELIQALVRKAEEDLPPKEIPVTIIFDGKAQPNLTENPHVAYLTHQASWLSEQEFEGFARRSVYDDGLSITDWFAAEHPNVTWMGQAFSVRGVALMVFRRRISENVLVIGGANAARYGMLAAILTGLALNKPPSQMAFIVLDRSIPNTAWHSSLEQAVDRVLRPNGFSVSFHRESHEANDILEKLIQELERRGTLGEKQRIHEPSLFVLMSELDRVDDLRRRADTYSMAETPLGAKLNRLCVEGSSVGIHLIISFSGVRPMTHVIDERRSLSNFRHRVALQMSEDESLVFVRSRKASQLQSEGSTPICALYLDIENDSTLRFKPYSVESTIPFTQQIEEIGQQLSAWEVPS